MNNALIRYLLRWSLPFVDEQHLKGARGSTASFSTHLHQFALSASLFSRLALVCAFAILLCSFLAWPISTLTLYQVIKWLLILVTMGVLVHCWRLLSAWHCVLGLDNQGHVTVSAPDTGVCQMGFSRPPVVNPLLCIVFLQDIDTGENRLLCIWQDMLTDTEYRSLCRLLLRTRTVL
ncbi:protein YgfX [Shewanella sp.]|uniref:protein YgfX n=1 Tax=Shewanella sp. TaxID=50422 RepID=UPI004047A479